MSNAPSSVGAVALRRWLLGGVTLWLCSMLAASCTNVLGLEGHASAVSELCSLVDRCFGPEMLPDCGARMGERLTAASSEQRAAWLSDFGNKACLESCNNARLCLDSIPVCGATADGCATAEGCCGFSDNSAACTQGTCCMQDGRSCGGPEECCSGQCRDGLCGGTPCVEAGQPCQYAADCCTGTCDASGVCSDMVCLPAGAECLDPAECCSQACVPDPDMGRAVCGQPTCVPELGPCSPEYNPNGLPCCGVADCVFVTGEGEVCISGCRPIGSQCDQDGDCCSGPCNMGICDPPLICGAYGEMCTLGSECCAGQCHKGACCEPTACEHNVCTTGRALAAGCPCGVNNCDGGTTNNPDIDGCVSTVCSKDPYCCCVKWDAACVQSAQSSCNIICPVERMPGMRQPAP